jgi:hypothetical protein
VGLQTVRADRHKGENEGWESGKVRIGMKIANGKVRSSTKIGNSIVESAMGIPPYSFLPQLSTPFYFLSHIHSVSISFPSYPFPPPFSPMFSATLTSSAVGKLGKSTRTAGSLLLLSKNFALFYPHKKYISITLKHIEFVKLSLPPSPSPPPRCPPPLTQVREALLPLPSPGSAPRR